MAVDIRITRVTLLIFFVLVIGYIIALFSLLDDAPKINNALSERLELQSNELYSLRKELAAKDKSIKQLNAKVKESKSDVDSGDVNSKSSKKEDAILKAIEKSSTDTYSSADSDHRQYSLFKSNRVVRQGVIVLGMHRSGTSILGGLLNKMGLKTGGPLIRPNTDNEKGFFERIDVVLQNDNFLSRQNSYYGLNLYKYSPLLGLKSFFTDPKPNFFNEGKRGLAFLNDPNNYPWMLKDPRLCVTFRTWLPLLNFVPAIIFTYRHPYDVAMSLHTRYEKYKIARGLKLWYIHNKMAIKQSADMCRVVTAHSRYILSMFSYECMYECMNVCICTSLVYSILS